MKSAENLGKYDLPSWIIRLGEMLSRDWITVRFTESFDGRPWQEGASNPEARRLARTWNKFIILGVARDNLEMMRRSKLEDVSLTPAVAYRYRDQTHVGKLPDGFGELDEGQTLAAGMRQGYRPIVATLGLLDSAAKILYVPPGVHIVEDLVSAQEFPYRYDLPAK